MSDRIKRMLAERARSTQAHEAARRRGIWTRVGKPREHAFRFGFDLVRRYLAGLDTEPTARALAEGMVMGMMDGFVTNSTEGWRLSESRETAIEEARTEAERT